MLACLKLITVTRFIKHTKRDNFGTRYKDIKSVKTGVICYVVQNSVSFPKLITYEWVISLSNFIILLLLKYTIPIYISLLIGNVTDSSTLRCSRCKVIQIRNAKLKMPFILQNYPQKFQIQFIYLAWVMSLIFSPRSERT